MSVGHNQKVLRALRSGRRLTPPELVAATGLTPGQVDRALWWMSLPHLKRVYVVSWRCQHPVYRAGAAPDHVVRDAPRFRALPFSVFTSLEQNP